MNNNRQEQEVHLKEDLDLEGLKDFKSNLDKEEEEVKIHLVIFLKNLKSSLVKVEVEAIKEGKELNKDNKKGKI